MLNFDFLLPLLIVILVGLTQELEANPTSCDVVRCGWGSVCVIVDGRAKCECPLRQCAAIYQPVCGTDGKTYSNACVLAGVECMSQGKVTKKSDGECDESGNSTTNPDPVSPPKTSPPKPINRRPQCGRICAERNECIKDGGENCDRDVKKFRCKCKDRSDCDAMVCPVNIQAVCGTDGKTYASECEIERSNCKTGQNVKLAHNGGCKSSEQPPTPSDCCLKLKMPECTKKQLKSGDTTNCKTPQDLEQAPLCDCQSDQPQGDKCNTFCPQIFKQVCGSDGVTYSNTCYLDIAACKQGKKITVAYEGPCKESTKTSNPKGGSNCDKICSKLESLVEHCKSNDEPEFRHDSELDQCHNSRLRSMAKRCQCWPRRPRNPCSRACPKHVQYVCGSDGISYLNECLLSIAYCDRGIEKEHDGRCESTTKGGQMSSFERRFPFSTAEEFSDY